MMDEDIW